MQYFHYVTCNSPIIDAATAFDSTAAAATRTPVNSDHINTAENAASKKKGKCFVKDVFCIYKSNIYLTLSFHFHVPHEHYAAASKTEALLALSA